MKEYYIENKVVNLFGPNVNCIGLIERQALRARIGNRVYWALSDSESALMEAINEIIKDEIK